MEIKTKICTGVIMASIAFLYAACEPRSNTATETSATGRTADESANTEHTAPVKLKDYVTGDWTLDPAAGNGTGTSVQRITFTTEGKYLRYAGSQQADSGLYRVNEQQKVLYLESQGKGDPTEWTVTIKDNNQMTLALRGGNQEKSDSLTYRRQ